MTERYPFGRNLHAVMPSASGPRRVFVLGAYPSALHVHWTPPRGRPVNALAVDDEPEPFWNGADEAAHIAAWRDAVRPPVSWGEFAGAGSLNGSSGRYLDQQYLAPLDVGRDDVWVTDAVDRHFLSSGGQAALDREYRPLMPELGLPDVTVRTRPPEEQLVTEAVAHHRDRLLGELDEAEPRDVLTLGNEALVVLWSIGVQPLQPGNAVARLSAPTYGRRLPVRLPNGHECVLHPLAHPGFLFTQRGPAHPGRDAFRHCHAAWADSRGQLRR